MSCTYWMRIMNTAERLKNIEFALLCLLALVLPVLEAPKNLAVVLLFGVWLARQIFFEPLRPRRPDKVEFALIWLILASVVSTALNWPSPGELKGVKDTAFGVFVCWTVYRSGLSPRRHYLLAVMVAVGVMVGLAWGTIDVLRGVRSLLEFNSAGVVTQSSIYLGIALVMSFGVAYAETGRQHALWWLATALMLVGLFLMASRGSILAVGLVGLFFLLTKGNRKVWLIGLLSLALAAGTALLLPDKFNQARFVEKSRLLMQTRAIDQNDNLRFTMWRIGAAQFVQGGSPLFGIGPRNFSAIDLAALKFDPPLTLTDKRLNHAHNLFLTKLAEEGLFGLSALLYLFWRVGAGLVRDWRSGNRLGWPWFGALGALAVPVIAGFFNTPWYQEHALLAMMLFGVYFSAWTKISRHTPAPTASAPA